MVDKVYFIRNKREEIISNLIELIKAKTINPPGDTREGISKICRILEEYGVNYRIIEPVEGKQSLVAEIGRNHTKSLILNGHIDVVPVSPNWKFDPFEGVVKGNKIYGRGASDMKSGVIALLYSFLAYIDDPPGNLILSIVADEETGGDYGARYLLEKNYINGDSCLVAEPTGNLNKRKYSIVGGEKGILWFKLVSKGKTAHGSLPILGENAIRKLIRLINKFPEVIPRDIMIPTDAKELIENGKAWLKSIKNGLEEVLDKFTFNVGVIRGGEKANIVPDRCEAQIDMRIPIGATSEIAFEIVKQEIVSRDDFDVEIINRTEPSYTPIDTEIVKALKSAVQKHLGYLPKYICMSATSDARFFRFSNIPTVNFGPGYLEVAHTDNEFIYIEDVLKFSEIYVDFVEKFFSS